MANAQARQVGQVRAGWVRLGQVDEIGRVEQVDQVGDLAPVLLQRVRSEFLEMPGLSVTFWQAMRLWNLDASVCRAVLDVLVQGGFLTETRHGAFRRVGG